MTMTAEATTGSPILEALRERRPVVSLGIRNARTTEIVRMAHGAGFGVVWIDLEHSSMGVDAAAQMAASAVDLGMAAWVRIPERNFGMIGRLLDCGADGIIAPMVETVEDAQALAVACRFPPTGKRSMLGGLPQFYYERMPPIEMTRRANAAVVTQTLIESARGVANVDAIAAVAGIDILAIGTNDLTADLGCQDDLSDPRFTAACASVLSAATRHGKIAVIGGIGSHEAFYDKVTEGFAPLIFAGIDTDILAQSLAARVAHWTAQ